MRTRFRFLSLAAIAVLAIALVACDDDDNDNGAGPGDPTPENGAPTEPDDGNGNGDNGDGAPGEPISLTMLDIEFSETALTIPSGEEVEFELINEGSLEHDFTIDEIDADYEATGAAVSNGNDWDLHVDVPPGESGGMLLTVNEPGTYDFYCTVPGHVEAGMEGTLTVE